MFNALIKLTVALFVASSLSAQIVDLPTTIKIKDIPAAVNNNVTWLNNNKVTVGSPNGCSASGIAAKIGFYQILTTDNGYLLEQTASANFTLPATPPAAPWCVVIQNQNAASITVGRNGNTINGGTSQPSLNQNDSVTVWSNGTGYYASSGASSYPASGIPNSTGTSWSTSYGFVTTLGSPGSDTNIASEKAIRSAIAAINTMIYPSAGIAVSTGSAWTTPYAVTTTLASPGVDTKLPTEKAVRTAIAAISSAPVTAGTFANLPGSPIINQTYFFKDSIYENAWYDGSAWHYYIGGLELTPPTGLASMNMTPCTITTNRGGELIACNPSGSTGTAQQSMRYETYPATPFTRTVAMRFTPYTNFQGAGLGLSDGTQIDAIALQYNTGVNSTVANISVFHCPTVASCNSTPGAAIVNPALSAPLLLFRLNDTGTTRTWSFSSDYGITFYTILAEASGARFTPTRIGPMVTGQTGTMVTSAWVAGWSNP